MLLRSPLLGVIQIGDEEGGEHEYMNEKSSYTASLPLWLQRVLQASRIRRAFVAGLVCTAFVYILLTVCLNLIPSSNGILRLIVRQTNSSIPIIHNKLIQSPHPAPAQFHLLVPSSSRDVNLCKNVLSSTLLRYPTTTIINWDKTFNDEKLASGGSHIAKIAGVLDYLKGLNASQAEELVLLVDGYDIWFQLDPHLLLSRYSAINERAQKRILADIGEGTTRLLNLTQTIVFSSQKKCWPGASEDSWCSEVPAAELPEEVYGPNTDKEGEAGEDELDVHARRRQRFLNSGVALGPAKDMRAMFERAYELVQVDANTGSDQSIFAQIFGAQELTRKLVRDRYDALTREAEQTKPPSSRHNEAVKDIDMLEFHAEYRDHNLDPYRDYEFSIGLDYLSELGQPTVFADKDLGWVQFNDSDSVSAARDSRNISLTLSNPLYVTIQDDLVNSSAPFNTISDSPISALPGANMPWTNVSLYTNLYTGITPGIIHHNAHRDGLKSNRETMWERIWFQPYARTLLAQRLQERPSTTARPEVKQAAAAGGFYVKTDKAGQEWVGWDELCDAEMQEEVFRDGRGQFGKEEKMVER